MEAWNHLPCLGIYMLLSYLEYKLWEDIEGKKNRNLPMKNHLDQVGILSRSEQSAPTEEDTESPRSDILQMILFFKLIL